MESLLIILISILIIVNIGMFFLLLKKKTEIKEDKTEQVFKDEINALRNSFSQSFGSMSKDIAKDNLQNVKGKVFKLKKPASEKKADRMMGYKLDEPTESAELKSFINNLLFGPKIPNTQ